MSIENKSNSSIGHVLPVSVFNIFIIFFVAVSIVPLSYIIITPYGDQIANNAYAKYTRSQTQSLVNNCQVNNSVGSPNCAINSPQIQADGSASTPTGSQISEIKEEGPGSQGPIGQPGPISSSGPGSERIAVVTLEDNDTGHAAGWNPPNGMNDFDIASPFDITNSTFIKASYSNPTDLSPRATGECFVVTIFPIEDHFRLNCRVLAGQQGDFPLPSEGAILTYIITK